MKRMIFLFLAVSLCYGQTTVDLPFNEARSLLLVTVRMDGQSKILIFDSGAERTMIQDMHGDREHRTTVELPGRTLTNFPIIYSNLAGLPVSEVKADGILGQDVIRQFRTVQINYNSKTIILEGGN